ncbi:MAG TPA: efflux RND transporter periplasmic adaptor subunit [Myxococcota bacterium]|nr:efflux RND transporter periplasmic adaptor subunit [Myxococcota bacterium]
MRSKSLGSLCAAAALLAGCSKQAPPPPSPQVVVANVETRDFPVTSEWLGTTKGEVDAEIRAQVSGYLIAQSYKEGQQVKKGDVLFRIDPAPFKASLAEARGQLGSAQANLQREHQNVERYRPLVDSGAVSRQEFDNAVQRERAAKAESDTANAALQKAQIDLGFTEIRSPVDGIAGIAKGQLGELVGPASGPLTTVSQLDPIVVSFPLSEQEYLRFAPQISQAVKEGEFKGGTVELVLADGKTYPQVGVAYPAGGGIDQRTGTITIKARFPNPDNVIRAGQFARVRAKTQTLKGALLIPQRAIIDLQGQKQVAVVTGDNKVELRTVVLGPKSATEQVVSSGLAAGDRIVIDGYQKVRPGMTVVAVAATPDVAAPAPGSSAEN